VPFNWTRIGPDEVTKVQSFETRQNADGTLWVLIDTAENQKVSQARRLTHPTVEAAKQLPPFPTSSA
jgi:hypothetical protein